MLYHGHTLNYFVYISRVATDNSQFAQCNRCRFSAAAWTVWSPYLRKDRPTECLENVEQPTWLI